MTDVSTLLDEGAAARRENRIDDARAAYGAALKLARIDGAPRPLIDALRGAGNAERDAGHDDAAASLYAEAVGLARGIGESRLLAHALRHLGELQLGTGEVGPAGDHLEEALERIRGAADAGALEIANTLRAVALLRQAQAVRLWKEARDLYAAAGIEAGVAESRQRLDGLCVEARPLGREA